MPSAPHTQDTAAIALEPVLTHGSIVEVNDTAVVVDIQGRLGVVTVPRPVGQRVEFWFSYLQVVAAPIPAGASDPSPAAPASRASSATVTEGDMP